MSIRALIGAAPVEPDAPQARRWLNEELADPIYHQSEGLLVKVMRWITEFLDRMLNLGQGSNPLTLVLITGAVIAVVAAIAFYVAGPVRRRKRATQSVDVLGDDLRTAAELRASATAFAQTGQWRLAVLDQFRALVRGLEERAVLDVRPGRTADEAARLAGDRFPEFDPLLIQAGRMFDAVYYGEHDVDAASCSWMADLDAQVQQSRPTLPKNLLEFAGTASSPQGSEHHGHGAHHEHRAHHEGDR